MKDLLSTKRQTCGKLQLDNGLHCHIEQPEGSKMLRHLSFVHMSQIARPCKFDLCTVGDLRHPETNELIKKRLIVLTTSKALFEAMHQRMRMCPKTHKHHQIAGSVRNPENNRGMALSEFTERYPSKFARQNVAVRIEDHPTKRRRVSQKTPTSICNPTWENITHEVDRTARRVRPPTILQGPIIEAVRLMCPDKEISHVVLRRGIDRMLGPTKVMFPGEGPQRKMVRIRRRFEDIVVEPEWEDWERLSYRQLRRKCTAARVSVTVFAKPKSIPGQNNSQEYELGPEDSDKPSASKRKEVMEDTEQDQKEGKIIETSTDAETSTDTIPEDIDLAGQKHGPKFLELKQEEQQWIIKLHKKLGHPVSQKLQTVWRHLKCGKHIIGAIPDLRCSACIECKKPVAPRPAVVHEERDFGDVVSMDGVTWTNKAGTQFHFYHFVDHSTTFQTAFCSPCRTAESAIRAITQGWISWSGPPGLLCVDSAGEFCNEEFNSFLQRHNIKLRMVPPEGIMAKCQSRKIRGDTPGDAHQSRPRRRDWGLHDARAIPCHLHTNKELLEQV